MDLHLQAALALIARSEGTSTSLVTKDDGYDVIVTGVDGMHTFTDYSTHPFSRGGVQPITVRPGLLSTASGRYQILLRYWLVYKTQLKLSDFGHASQDSIALQMLKEIKAYEALLDGDYQAAIGVMHERWASFPGSTAGQGGHSFEQEVSWFQSFLPDGTSGLVVA